jgi:hypothetical protein
MELETVSEGIVGSTGFIERINVQIRSLLVEMTGVSLVGSIGSNILVNLGGWVKRVKHCGQTAMMGQVGQTIQ